MQLHIVRHGQTDWNAKRRIQGQLDSQLDEVGQQQAIDRSSDFAKMALNAVYSSSSLRTRQTTELVLGDRHDLVTFRDDLREVRLGVWQGFYWADIERDHPEMVEAHNNASPDFNVEGAEKSSEVQERGVAAIESIIAAHNQATESDNILIVSHGAIMKTILAHYLDVPLSDMITLPSLPNCAHCIIEVIDDQRRVLTISSTPLEETPWSAENRTTRSSATHHITPP